MATDKPTAESLVYISVGSNCKNKEVEMVRAVAWLDDHLSHMRYTEPYPTRCLPNPEKGFTGLMPDGSSAPHYLNCVVRGLTRLDPASFQALLKEYEEMAGRQPNSPVITIDLDLVVYGSSLLRPADFSQPYFQQGFLLLAP